MRKVDGRLTGRLAELALEASSNGVVITDALREDNPIVYVNPAFERITGYAAEEAVGRNCRFLRDLDDEQPGLDDLRAALREERGWTGVLRNRGKNGTPFWNELHLAPVRDAGGRLTNYIGVQTDVTARRLAEEEISRTSRDYEGIIRKLPNVVYKWRRDAPDAEMRATYVEGALAEQFEVTTDRVAGKTLPEVFPPEFLETVGPAFERAFTGETVEFSSRIGERTFSNVAMPFFSEARAGGAPVAEIVGYVTEVTRRDRAEKALEESRERFEVAIRGSNDGIWDWDLTTNEVYFSPHWKEMLGYEDHELENRFEEWQNRLHPEDLERAMTTVRGYLDGRTGNYELEHRLLHKDGTYRWILARGASMRDGAGKPHRMAGSHTDITGRKILEQQLKHQAFHDPLTGLPNRALLMERLEHALLRTKRNGGAVAVLFVDLDGFKDVNDSWGHETGDGLLVGVAGRLREGVRPGDTVARLGGDEFIALLEDVTHASDAVRVAERVAEKLRPTIPVAGREIPVTASLGIALGDFASATPEDLVRQADGAMYRAKGRGRGLYELHDDASEAAPEMPRGSASLALSKTNGADASGGAAPPRAREGRGAVPKKNGADGDGTRCCSRCETLPEKLAGPGRLYLWLPLDHTLSKAYRHLRGGGWICETARDYAVVVNLEDGRVSDLLAALGEVLTGREMEDTRALFKPGGDGLTVSDIPRARPLSELSALGGSGWLLDMLSEGRLTSHFQPIVRVEDPREVFAQECLLRGIGVDGGLVSPDEIFGAAKRSQMLFQTDLAARRTAIREAMRHGVGSKLFINFTPTSVYDPKFCLRSTVEAIDETGFSPEQIVFEVTESEETNDMNHLTNIVNYYREKGFKVALDDMGSGYSSLNMIHLLKPDFIKLDMQLIRDVDSDPYKALVAQKVLEMAQGLRVETIAEGVETEGELFWAREHGATFAQGYLIAKPTSPPAKNVVFG